MISDSSIRSAGRSAAARVIRAAAAAALAGALALTGACANNARITGPIGPVSPNDPFLDTVEVRTFRWFWDTTDPATGLTPDRWPSRTFSSVAAIGFGLSAYVVGAERGYVSRDDAAARSLATLRYLWQLPQGPTATGVAGYKGFFYHFLDLDTGLRFQTVELSTIDTSLLLMGALTCQQYFDGASATEVAIRAYADSLYRRVDWRWAVNHPPLVSMGWHPESGFIADDWRGYNEGSFLYFLALGSPTYGIDSTAWEAWTSTYPWMTFYGRPHVNFAPLFGHQYTQVWVDMRGIQDAYMRGKGIDYFENSRRATLSQRDYAVANPQGWIGYGANTWGLTAADGPKDTTLAWNGRQRQFFSYSARGAAANEVRDDGTLAPTALGGSVPFAPEVTVPALEAIRRRYGDAVFNQYGFLDSFNPTYRFAGALPAGRIAADTGWFDTDQLGIDQGPILLMIENYRTGLLWRLMRGSPYIQRGLRRAGFAGGWLDAAH